MQSLVKIDGYGQGKRHLQYYSDVVEVGYCNVCSLNEACS